MFQRSRKRAMFANMPVLSQRKPVPARKHFSVLLSPKYTIRFRPHLAPKSRASMKIRNQMYAPPNQSNHCCIPAKSQAQGASRRR